MIEGGSKIVFDYAGNKYEVFLHTNQVELYKFTNYDSNEKELFKTFNTVKDFIYSPSIDGKATYEIIVNIDIWNCGVINPRYADISY